MNCSIIIPTCNRKNELIIAIKSILVQTWTPYEIIIIDQSDDEEVNKLIDEAISNSGKQIKFIYIRQSYKNSAHARNKGMSLATGDIISFFDDDVVLFDDYLENIMRHFNSNKLIAGLSGNVVIRDKLQGWKWELRKILLRLFLLNNFDGKMTISGFGFPIFEREIEKPQEVEMLPGCNMNYRKEFLGDDKFDVWFSGYCYREDADISYRISRKGILKMIPEAKLYHNYSKLNRADPQTQKIMEVKNYSYFYRKLARKNILTDFLFLYSMFGLFVIIILEYISSFNAQKYSQLKGFLKGVIKMC
jgi:glycosyltransferase involved in cell wall biosynthesis